MLYLNLTSCNLNETKIAPQKCEIKICAPSEIPLGQTTELLRKCLKRDIKIFFREIRAVVHLKNSSQSFNNVVEIINIGTLRLVTRLKAKVLEEKEKIRISSKSSYLDILKVNNCCQNIRICHWKYSKVR